LSGKCLCGCPGKRAIPTIERACCARESAHMHRVSGRKCIIPTAGNGHPVQVPGDGAMTAYLVSLRALCPPFRSADRVGGLRRISPNVVFAIVVFRRLLGRSLNRSPIRRYVSCGGRILPRVR
jgi:hypothetical protein